MIADRILVIVFGQLGDVVLSLPALQAIRDRFPAARITVAVGKACADILAMVPVADETLVVDRVALRDGPRLWALRQILAHVRDVRARRFDLVIDLHSLSETNLLGFVSGAPARLFAHRKNRSLEWLGTIRAPREDRAKHLSDRYADVVHPLGVAGDLPRPRLAPRPQDRVTIERRWATLGLRRRTIGLFPGAGHASRRWPLERFAAVATALAQDGVHDVVVFLGPEELELPAQVAAWCPAGTVIIDGLSIPELVAAVARLDVLIGNDTGPMHIAAATGTPVVIVLDASAPRQFLPVGSHVRLVSPSALGDITVDPVLHAARALLAHTAPS